MTGGSASLHAAATSFVLVALPTVPVIPAAVRNFPNGQIPDDHLVPVRFGPRTFLHASPADRAFAALAGRAFLAGFDLRSTGANRTWAEQHLLFRTRYRQTTVSEFYATPAEHRKIWTDARENGYDSVYWVKIDRTFSTAAAPGTSNHGRGLSNDLAEELDGDVQPEAISRAAVSWLRANAWSFGIVNEVPSEVWHWTFMLGDTITAATLAWEHEASGEPLPPPLPPPPPPPAPAPLPKVKARMLVIVGNQDNKQDPRRWVYDGMRVRLLLDEPDFHEIKAFGWLHPAFDTLTVPFWKPIAWIVRIGG